MRRFVLSLFIFFTCSHSWANNHCFRFLTQINESSIDETDNLLSYLRQLFEQNTITSDGLKKLKKSIEENKNLTNPVPHKMTSDGVIFTSSVHKIHYGLLEDLLKSPSLRRNEIHQWIIQTLKIKEIQKETRENSEKKTIIPFVEMKFHRIDPDPQDQPHAKITHPFEMMETLVTQKMWVDLMGENPSAQVDGPHTVVIEINGKPIKMQPDNPVENITALSAMEFANRLSKKHNLPPVYDFSQMIPREGSRPENGTWDMIGGEIKINAVNGDLQLAEGFRPLTETEAWKVTFIPLPAGADPQQFFWFEDNARLKSQPVATLNPMIINENPFYDLRGNAAIWLGEIQPWMPNQPIPLTASITNYTCRSSRNSIIDKFDHSITARQLSSRGEALGLRLARTLK